MLTQSERISFLQVHNQYRNDVGKTGNKQNKPTAAGMMRMVGRLAVADPGGAKPAMPPNQFGYRLFLPPTTKKLT